MMSTEEKGCGVVKAKVHILGNMGKRIGSTCETGWEVLKNIYGD